jgi:hypothetical protein
MMSNYEHYIGEDTPTHSQLRRLASIGVRLAVHRDKLRLFSRRTPEGMNVKAHYVVDELDIFDNHALEEGDLNRISHRMAIRIGSRRGDDGLKVMSLKFFDTYAIEDHESGVRLGERTRYRFEWNRARILMADRTFRLIGVYHPEDELEYYLDRLNFPDDTADILYAEQQLGTVTEGDCEQIIEAAHDYFGKVDSMHDYVKR